MLFELHIINTRHYHRGRGAANCIVRNAMGCEMSYHLVLLDDGLEGVQRPFCHIIL